MYQVKTMNKISPLGLEIFPREQYAIGEDFTQEEAIILRSAKLHDYAFPESLLAVARAGAGVNNIPLERCAESGIVVFNTPGANANGVKELVLCSLLLSSRNVAGGIAWLREQARQGEDVTQIVEKGKAAYAGPEILGKTLGVVGLGAIGRLVANAARALGMQVVGYDPMLSVPAALALDPQVQVVKTLGELYAAADYLTLHVPMTPDTRQMLCKDSFAQMKDGVRIVNLARGELVAEEDLMAALDSGKVAFYATDFPTTALSRHEKVLPLPHLGASTPESEDNCAMMAARELRQYLESGIVVNSVNLPNLDLPWQSAYRLSCVAKNSDELQGALLAALKQAGLSPVAQAANTRGDYVYFLFDLDAAPTEETLSALRQQSGVLRLRLLSRS